MNKDNLNIEDYKDLVDSRLPSKKMKRDNSDQLMRARLNAFSKENEKDALMLNLYQLKLMMEEEVSTEELKSAFYTYISSYVDLLYKTRKSFAHDIKFSQTQLSLILSGKRPATEEFVHKVCKHSNAIYTKINLDFNEKNWFYVFYQDKMYRQLNSNADESISIQNLNDSFDFLKDQA